MKHSDFAAMPDKGMFNCGFIIVKPTAVNIKVYKLVVNFSYKTRKLNDQQILNKVVRGYRRENKAAFLSKRLYMDGLLYFLRMNRPLPWTNDPCSAVNKTICSVLVVHNNWIITREAKIYRFREHFMWSYDGKDAYYSSQSRNYIMYTNPDPYNISRQDLRDSQLSSLVKALALGYLLNRTVILPKFYCSTMGHTCPLHSHIRMVNFDNVFDGKYRESNFLLHAKVPDDVKQYPSRQPLTSHATRVSSSSEQYTIDSKRVVSLFYGRKDRLINFGILSGIKITFSDNSTKNTFNQKVYRGFRGCDYRQFRIGEYLGPKLSVYDA